MREDREYNKTITETAVLEKRCQGCGRQCPLNALACERGRRLNGGIDMEERNEQYEGDNGHKGHEGHLEGKTHGRLDRHVHHDFHKEEGKGMAMEKSAICLLILRKRGRRDYLLD